MERAMSVEDKIRRAEEIYYKRREQEMPIRETMKRTPKEKKNIKLLKKMIKICYTEKKDKQVVKLMRIENIESIEEQ